MRTKLTIFVALIALAFAGTAQANTVSLIWQGSGTSVTSAAPSSTVTADIVLTISGAGSPYAFAFSISYSGGLTETAGAGTCGGRLCAGTPVGNGWFDATLLDQGSGGVGVAGPAVESTWAYDQGGPTMTAATATVGTISFHVGAAGSAIAAFLNTGAGDGCNFGGCNGTVTFNGATVNVVPEPGTIALLTAGLAGLGLVGRRSRR